MTYITRHMNDSAILYFIELVSAYLSCGKKIANKTVIVDEQAGHAILQLRKTAGCVIKGIYGKKYGGRSRSFQVKTITKNNQLK